jgi:hypothetical protein
MRISALTLGLDRAGSVRRETRAEVYRGTGCSRGMVGTDAESGADCVLYPAGVYAASRGGRPALWAGCYQRFEEGSVDIVGHL